jgi:Cys-tRNA(Pro)/Cys-tRNA(Cys) deacylase
LFPLPTPKTLSGVCPSIQRGVLVNDTPALVDPRLVGTRYTVHRHGPVDSLEEAAALRGVEPSAIVKTIVVRRNDDDYAFILVPGDRVIDWPKLRNHLGQRRLSMPDAEEALAVTGYVRGTITPFGSTNPWAVTADEALVGTIVSIGGGAPGVSLTMSGDDVIQALAADVADVTKTR